jgi:hypothetical protein
MPEIIRFHFKRTPLSTRRTLTIDPLFIELEGPLANKRFVKEDIEAFRFGSAGFRFYFFAVSRTYNIEVKCSQNKIMLIRMHSFFGLGKKKIQNLFSRIHGQIQNAYFNEIAIHYVRLLDGGLTYELGGVFLTDEGILLKKEKQLIPWIRIGLKSYFESFSIYDITDPFHYRSFDYWHDWNASLLHAVIYYKTHNLQLSTL